MVILRKFLFLVTEPSLMKGRVVGFRFERVPFNTTSLIWSSVFWEMNRFFKWISINLGLISMFSHTQKMVNGVRNAPSFYITLYTRHHFLTTDCIDFLLIYIVSSALILLVFGSQSYLASSARGMRVLVIVQQCYYPLKFRILCFFAVVSMKIRSNPGSFFGNML